LQAVYTDGANRYNLQDLAAVNYAMWGGTNACWSLPEPRLSRTLRCSLHRYHSVPRAKLLRPIKTWGFRGATPITGSVLEHRHLRCLCSGQTATSVAITICASASLALPLAACGCNPDFNIAQVGIITRWTPVKNLTFSADLTYTRLDQK
jgi:hypothetical protein